MEQVVFTVGMVFLAFLLFFNFYPQKSTTKHVFGLFGGVFALLFGVLTIVNGVEFHTGEVQNIDTIEFTNSNNDTITNTTINTTFQYEEKQAVNAFQHGDIYGLFLTILGIFILFGNLFGLMRT